MTTGETLDQGQEVPLEALIEADSRGMALSLWASRQPDVSAIRSPYGERSFAELNARANQLARALRRGGLVAGDSIALLCRNRPEFVEVMAAAQRTGLRITPVNWHLSAEEVEYIVRDCDARALVADGDFAAAAEGCVSPTLRLAVGGSITGFDDYAAALAGEPDGDIDDATVGSLMLYTSGTTGHPKGVDKPPIGRQLLRMLRTYQAAGYRPGGHDRHLCTGPLYHAAPLAFSLNMPLADGIGVTLMDGWDAEICLRLLAEESITHTHMVPIMFHRLLRLPEALREKYRPIDLRFVIHGAAPCPVATKQAMMDWLGPVIWEYYAATEGSGAVVSPEEWLARPGTVGKPPTPDHVRILDPEGNALPPGEVGTVYLQLIPGMEFRYHKAPDKTAASRRGTYFTLGDVGYLDADGYLFLTDRSAHLIISGGVNIYPAEVEAALLDHPAVLDVGVIGVPNPEWGEEVKAVVELSPGHDASEALAAQLVAHCRERIARFKCPRSVDFVDTLPRHDNGKLYKQRLRSSYRSSAK